MYNKITTPPSPIYFIYFFKTLRQCFTKLLNSPGWVLTHDPPASGSLSASIAGMCHCWLDFSHFRGMSLFFFV